MIGNPSSRTLDRPRSHWGRYTFWSIAIGATLLATPFRVVEVSGESMMPTLRDGERYLMDRFYYKAGGLKRDDVIIVHVDKDELVKRLVGLPGDRLEVVMDPDRNIYELANLTTGQKGTMAVPPGGPLRRVPVTVPPNHIYVLGDNWWRSDDSRTFGPIPETRIRGLLRTFTLSRSFPRQQSTLKERGGG
jgi:signal peptidase I